MEAEASAKPKLLGELLLEKGLLEQKNIDFCLHEQRITGEKMGLLFERFGFVTQYDVAKTVSEQLKCDFTPAEDVVPETAALKLFSLTMCRQNQFIPVSIDDTNITIVTSNRNLATVKQIVEGRSGRKAIIQFSEEDKIQQMLYHVYFFMDNPVEQLIQNEITNIIADRDAVRPLDNLLQNIFRLAIKERATDVHVRPLEKTINIAFRIDGVIRSMMSLGNEFKRLISTIKLRATMDIADSRLPQDGAFVVDINEKIYDVRVSTIVCPYGESAVMRILQRDNEVLRLSQLGFLPKHLATIEEAFQQPSGIILLTGPTGSGKTTTLHAGVRSMDILNSNIVTVEDPIEYRIPLVRQTEVNAKSGYTFSQAIRHFLRHDPDVILVGEIRDPETAKIAVTAAETGHLVLSTLHTNNALGVVPRLRALGVENHMIADSLKCCISQRLVRRVCPSCKETHVSTQEEMEFLELENPVELVHGEGCAVCSFSGYRGREPIYEVFVVNQAFLNAIEASASTAELMEIATNNESVFIHDVAVEKVLAGVTTVEEVKYLAPKKEH